MNLETSTLDLAIEAYRSILECKNRNRNYSDFINQFNQPINNERNDVLSR